MPNGSPFLYFRYIQCIDSEDGTTNDVVVTPGTNDVTIIWPTEGNADTYTIVIKKDGEVFWRVYNPIHNGGVAEWRKWRKILRHFRHKRHFRHAE